MSNGSKGNGAWRHGHHEYGFQTRQRTTRSRGAAVPYGYIVSMKIRPGHRDDVVAIPLSGVDGLRQAGCDLYVVSASDADDVTI